MLQLFTPIFVAQASRNNTRAILNVCFAYTSGHEFEHAAEAIRDGVERKEILIEYVFVYYTI